jgi:putative transposase
MNGRPRYDPERHRRQSTRRPGWDYAGAGRYFVTICSFDREPIFGDVVDGVMHLSEIGHSVEQAWLEIAVLNPHVLLDAYVVMPNHLHGIVIIQATDRQHGETISSDGQPRLVSGSLGAMIARFKREAIRRANQLPNVRTSTLWQRGYHDRIIPDNGAFELARTYIHNNPTNWFRDPDHPRNAHRRTAPRCQSPA